MLEEIAIGDRLVMAGKDGKPERVVEVTGVMARADGPAYEVRPLTSKRARFVATAELYRVAPLAKVGGA